MDSRSRAAAASRKSRRRKTYLITLAVVAVVIALIAYEQVALLYVISTLSVVALLVVVAWANIEGARRPAGGPPLDDSAALGTGLAPRVAVKPAPVLSSPRPAAAAPRRRCGGRPFCLARPPLPCYDARVPRRP